MLELQNICYRVSTPEGELDILRDISITIPDQRLMVSPAPTAAEKPPWPRSSWAWSSPPPAAFCITAGTSPPFHHRPGASGHQLRLSAAAPVQGDHGPRSAAAGGGAGQAHQGPVLRVSDQGGPVRQRLSDREVDVSLSGGEVKRIEIATILAAGAV